MKNVMTSIYPVLIFLITLWSGCHEIEPVEIVDEEDDAQLIEMKAVGVETDSVFVSSGVDSTGLIGSENSRYFAKMVFSAIRFDMPSRRDSLVQAEAIFLDKSSPIQNNGQVAAYPSFDVGTIAVESDTLNKHQRRMQMMMKDTLIGYRYQLKKHYGYESDRTFNWYGSGNDSINSFNIQFNTPPELQVEKIAPEYIQPTVPLYIKWKCNNRIVNLIISREGGLQQKTWVPVLHLQIRNEKGEITIPAKILEILPTKKYQRFLFTFSSSSKTSTTVNGYQDEILIQTASIHNLLLNVLQ